MPAQKVNYSIIERGWLKVSTACEGANREIGRKSNKGNLQQSVEGRFKTTSTLQQDMECAG